MRHFVVAGAIVAMMGAAAPRAQTQATALTPDQIVAVRKAMMNLQQGVLGSMKAAVDEKADVKSLVPGAKGLSISAHVIVSMFPVGTETANGTKAKPEIWSDPAGFAKAQANMVEAAEKLVPLAEANDKAGFATQFAALGRTCGGCHREYKMRD